MSLLVLFLLIASSQVAISANDMYAASVAPLLNENPSKNEKLGVVVKSLTTGETIFEHNPDKMYIPASNEKIITSVSALSLLGKDYRFKTEFYSGGGISNGVLHGGLYIKGYGDPTLSEGHIGYIVFQLKQRGVKEIKG
ncbi:MAG: D-alanyl-D-alanine carboxypeptidase, partial [Deltaproteobacteria bacterium]|nr:D-alanyl-D-alanine carboxypeptidase [Deltaproteobacteria bacterium]